MDSFEIFINVDNGVNVKISFDVLLFVIKYYLGGKYFFDYWFNYKFILLFKFLIF